MKVKDVMEKIEELNGLINQCDIQRPFNEEEMELLSMHLSDYVDFLENMTIVSK